MLVTQTWTIALTARTTLFRSQSRIRQKPVIHSLSQQHHQQGNSSTSLTPLIIVEIPVTAFRTGMNSTVTNKKVIKATKVIFKTVVTSPRNSWRKFKISKIRTRYPVSSARCVVQKCRSNPKPQAWQYKTNKLIFQTKMRPTTIISKAGSLVQKIVP
jgi:hypothetical protein